MVERLRYPGPAGRHGPHLPRPRAAASCATSGRPATTARRCRSCWTPSCRSSAALARQLPGHYRFTPAKDLADEIEWAKTRRIAPERLRGGRRGRRAPASRRSRSTCSSAPTTATSARRRARTGSTSTTCWSRPSTLLETDDEAAATVRARKRWFSVDEYQDTNPLQQRLLELWLGDRRDLCVVGDEDQTIYTFTGATPEFLTVRGPLARRPRDRPGPQLPVHAPGAGAREPAARGGRPRRSAWSRRARTARSRRSRSTRRHEAELDALVALDPGAAGGGDRARRRSRCWSA